MRKSRRINSHKDHRARVRRLHNRRTPLAMGPMARQKETPHQQELTGLRVRMPVRLVWAQELVMQERLAPVPVRRISAQVQRARVVQKPGWLQMRALLHSWPEAKCSSNIKDKDVQHFSNNNWAMTTEPGRRP